MPLKSILCSSLFLLSAFATVAQKASIEELSKTPRKIVNFPIEYAMDLPSLDMHEWDKDYNFFSNYVTPAVAKTQLGMSFTLDSVHHWICTPSARPHAQLDISTNISDPSKLTGTWRAVTSRVLQFQDSASYVAGVIYRNDSLLRTEDDDVFISFTQDHVRMDAKIAGNRKFKKQVNSKYHLENGRYLLMYKGFKAGGAIALVGLDKDGRFILNSATVEERKVKNKYIVYLAVLRQLIFEKVSDAG